MLQTRRDFQDDSNRAQNTIYESGNGITRPGNICEYGRIYRNGHMVNVHNGPVHAPIIGICMATLPPQGPRLHIVPRVHLRQPMRSPPTGASGYTNAPGAPTQLSPQRDASSMNRGKSDMVNPPIYTSSRMSAHVALTSRTVTPITTLPYSPFGLFQLSHSICADYLNPYVPTPLPFVHPDILNRAVHMHFMNCHPAFNALPATTTLCTVPIKEKTSSANTQPYRKSNGHDSSQHQDPRNSRRAPYPQQHPQNMLQRGQVETEQNVPNVTRPGTRPTTSVTTTMTSCIPSPSSDQNVQGTHLVCEWCKKTGPDVILYGFKSFCNENCFALFRRKIHKEKNLEKTNKLLNLSQFDDRKRDSFLPPPGGNANLGSMSQIGLANDVKQAAASLLNLRNSRPKRSRQNPMPLAPKRNTI